MHDMTVTGDGRHPDRVTSPDADPALIAVEELRGTLSAVLRSARPRTVAALRDAVGDALTDGGYEAERLPEFAAGDRPDFLTGDGIAIDLFGHADTASAVHRRVIRHAAHPQVKGVIAVACTQRQAAVLPDLADGKPVRIMHAHGRPR